MGWSSESLPFVANSPEGVIVEVGVYEGTSASILYRVAQDRKTKLYLFDTFEGLPCKSEFDIHNIGKFAASPGTYERLQQQMPEAKIYKGLFPDTLPNDLQNIAFVHEDTDQYESTKAVIEHLYPRLVKGGIILFDDYTTGDCPGSTKAIDECGYELHSTGGIEHNKKYYIIKV